MLSLLFGHKVHVGLTFLQEHYLRCYCLGLVFLLCKCDLKSKPQIFFIYTHIYIKIENLQIRSEALSPVMDRSLG